MKSHRSLSEVVGHLVPLPNEFKDNLSEVPRYQPQEMPSKHICHFSDPGQLQVQCSVGFSLSAVPVFLCRSEVQCSSYVQGKTSVDSQRFPESNWCSTFLSSLKKISKFLQKLNKI